MGWGQGGPWLEEEGGEGMYGCGKEGLMGIAGGETGGSEDIKASWRYVRVQRGTAGKIWVKWGFRCLVSRLGYKGPYEWQERRVMGNRKRGSILHVDAMLTAGTGGRR